jgi:hypothetical protein
MPRPRFTLRTALVATAIVAVLAWQGGIVWQRKAAMREIQHTFILAADRHADPAKLARITPLRRLLGDRAIQIIWVMPGENEGEDITRLRILFPEARVDSGSYVW